MAMAWMTWSWWRAARKPMLDAAEHGYRVVDPYYSFYGYGDPKLTATFGSEDPVERNLVILVIHGAGAEAWRSDTPKAKYVIINSAAETDCGEETATAQAPGERDFRRRS